MRVEDRNRCLEAVASLARVDPDNAVTEPTTTFLPLESTKRALAPDVWIVLGSRGSGKTALFRLVTDAKGRQAIASALEFSLDRTEWIRCFSATGIEEPDIGVLEDLAEYTDFDLRSLWACLLVRSIAAQCKWFSHDLLGALSWIPGLEPNRVREWLPRARDALGGIMEALDNVERFLLRRRLAITCCYDALDRISPFSRGMRRRHLRALLSLWSSLSSRYRLLRAKLFLREDLADPAELEFPDASKVLARAASLDWSHEGISRLLVRYLAAHSEEMRRWLSRVKGLVLREDPSFGWLPGPMPAAVRKAFTARLAGQAIGTGVFRVESGRWITGRLEDAHRNIVPRTALRFFGRAGEISLERAHDEKRRSPQLLHESDLSAALHFTSARRVAELRDDYPVVNRVFHLADVRIPVPIDEAIARLARPFPGEPAPLGEDGRAVLDELLRLGVLATYKNDAGEVVDVPDIYRVGFRIEVNYAAILQTSMARSDPRILQRGELLGLDSVLADQLQDSEIGALIDEAQQLFLMAKPDQAYALLENVSHIAERRGDPVLEALIFAEMARVMLSVDLPASRRLLAVARSILEENALRPRASALRRLVMLQECIALVSANELASVRSTLPELEMIAAEHPLYGDLLWVKAQLSLRERDVEAAEALGRELISYGQTQEDPFHLWRGNLVIASAVLMTGATSLSALSPIGLLPWAIKPSLVGAVALRLAALLSLTPTDDSAPIFRRDAEGLAMRFISAIADGSTLESMREEATKCRSMLLDEAVAYLRRSREPAEAPHGR